MKRDFERSARRVVRALGKENCVLIGGLAVGAHGYVRGTKDIDFIARISLADVQKRLSENGIGSTLHRGNPLDGDVSCVKFVLDGVRVDVLPPLVPIQWERAIELPLTKTEAIRVVDLDALIQLKLRAQSPKDLMDVAALVLRHPEYRERAVELATAHRALDRLTSWLQDPRLRAEIHDTEPPRARKSAGKAPMPRRGGT